MMHVCRLKAACDCTFIYWHRVMLPMYLADIHDNSSEAFRLRVQMSHLSHSISPASCSSAKCLLLCMHRKFVASGILLVYPVILTKKVKAR